MVSSSWVGHLAQRGSFLPPSGGELFVQCHPSTFQTPFFQNPVVINYQISALRKNWGMNIYTYILEKLKAQQNKKPALEDSKTLDQDLHHTLFLEDAMTRSYPIPC
jgi:hypothetical protein